MEMLSVGKKKASFDENDNEKGFLDLFVFSHLIHVEDHKSGLKTVSLRRGIAYEPKQTISHLIFVCPLPSVPSPFVPRLL